MNALADFGTTSSCSFLFRSSFFQLQQACEKAMQYNPTDLLKKLRARFIGEEGIDAGGLSRDLLTIVFQQAFDKKSCAKSL